MQLLEQTEELNDIMGLLVDVARQSTCCRSKCGSIIFDKFGVIIGKGFNSKPCNELGECTKDSLPKNFKSDKACCVHAEQRAIIQASKWGTEGSTLYFIRLDDKGNPTPSGNPWCTTCSKLALDTGVKNFMLWHKDGWTSYDTEEYNRLSFEYRRKEEDNHDACVQEIKTVVQEAFLKHGNANGLETCLDGYVIVGEPNKFFEFVTPNEVKSVVTLKDSFRVRDETKKAITDILIKYGMKTVEFKVHYTEGSNVNRPKIRIFKTEMMLYTHEYIN